MVALTSATVAVFAAALAGLLMSQRKRFKKAKDTVLKIEAVLMLLVGMGIGGVVGGMLTRLGDWVASMVAALTSHAFGVAVPAVVGIVLFGLFAIHMWKGHKPSAATPWIGLALAPVGLAALPGGAIADVINGLFGAIGDGASQAVSTLLGGA